MEGLAAGTLPGSTGDAAPFGACGPGGDMPLRVCIDLGADGDPERQGLEAELADDVRRLGGRIVAPEDLAAGPAVFAVVGHLAQPLAAAARSRGVPAASDWWLDACIEAGRVLPLADSLLYTPQRDSKGIPGMEDVVVSATGYTGAARAEVKELCQRAGAQYTGSLSRENTHLLCFDHSGDKHAMAKKWRAQGLEARPDASATPRLVNHRWIEDCNRAWRVVEEERYEGMSGREAAAQPPVPLEELAGTVAETDEEDGAGLVVPCSAPESGGAVPSQRAASAGGLPPEDAEPPLSDEHWEPDRDGDGDGDGNGDSAEAELKLADATAESEEEEEADLPDKPEREEDTEIQEAPEEANERQDAQEQQPEKKKRRISGARTPTVPPSPTPRRVAALQPRIPSRLVSLSGMHTWQKDYCAPMARGLGLRLERTREHQWRSQITHIVASQVRRCEKILAGMAAGVWILGSPWLEESHSKGEVLPEAGFEAVEPAGDLFEPGSLAHWRRRRETLGEGAFEGRRVGLIGRFRGAPKRPSAATLRNILEAGGATVVSPASDTGPLDFVVVPEEASKAPATAKALAESGIPCVAGAYVTDWVAFPHATLEDHFLFGTSAPPALLEAQRARGEQT